MSGYCLVTLVRWRGEKIPEIAIFMSPTAAHQRADIFLTLRLLFCSLLFSRFLNSKPQTPSSKPDSLSGPEDQQNPQAKQATSSPFDWSSFLCAAMKEERLKTDSSCLAMTEAEQGELYETIRHALHALRKQKVFMASTHLQKCCVCKLLQTCCPLRVLLE